MSEIDVDEEICPLDGHPPIERVILGEDVKLYRARVILGYLDGPVYDFESAALHFGNDGPVPVHSDDGKNIGFASVVYANGRFEADIAIDWACEERLLAETGEKIYARFFGTMNFKPMLLFDFQAKLGPTKLKIDGIVLSRQAPADPRVTPVGYPILSFEGV